ncbi:ATP-dependent DNA helicase pif1 [Fusarium oxysporum f. sp. conglutinans]|nr:ATP-dependent DNA helicase pif1 [Fusarium oxysporum f. sp. conglutinans]
MDNHDANDTMLDDIAKEIDGLDPVARRLRCSGHIMNLIVQAFLFRSKAKKIQEDEREGIDEAYERLCRLSEREEGGIITKAQATEEWREFSVLGKLHDLCIYTRSSTSIYNDFKAEIGRALPRDNDTRWNSWFRLIDVAIEKRAKFMDWIQENHAKIEKDALDHNDWNELGDIHAFLQVFHQISVRQGRENTLDEVLSHMDFLHHHFTRTKNRAFSGPRFYARFHVAWLKFEKYYQLTEQAPVYVAGILLHPALRKSYLSEQWKRNPAWVSNAVKAVRKIWSTEYKSYQLPDKQQEKGQELDEFDRWRQKVYSTASEVKDEFDRFIYGSQVGIGQQTALQWWLEPTQRENFPLLCRMAIDIFCIPPMSTEAERIFSGARRQVRWDRSSMSAKMVEAFQIFEKPKSSPAIFRQIQSNPNCLQSNNITDSLLHLPINKDFRPLSPIDKAQLQKKLKDIKYLIIDEKSMLGLRQLSWIDDRLREAFPSRNEEFFGGLNILLVGDFFQLPPVLQKPLYYDKEVQGVEIKGRNAYRRFDKTVFLKVVQRQRGDDQEAFRTALGELRLLQLSKESWKLLSSRVQAKLDDREVARFVNALRVYATKDRVNEYNHYHLDRLSRPAIQVTAKNVGSGAAAAPDDKAGNLAKQIPICLGARLMLTSNLWQPVGLCNGARGTVYDIGWAPGAEPIQDPPCVIMMEFDKYNGPVFLTTPDGKKIVPILPVERDFLIGATLCTRTQFPLIVCYAITVHKSQSITEDMIVTDLSCRDFQTGLSYVAVSRVKTLEGLMLDAPFDRNHLIYASPPDGMKMKMRDHQLRRRQVLTRNPYKTDHCSA